MTRVEPPYQIASGMSTQYAMARRNADAVVPPRARSTNPNRSTMTAVIEREIFVSLLRRKSCMSIPGYRLLFLVEDRSELNALGCAPESVPRPGANSRIRIAFRDRTRDSDGILPLRQAEHRVCAGLPARVLNEHGQHV